MLKNPQRASGKANGLVNTTPVGMEGNLGMPIPANFCARLVSRKVVCCARHGDLSRQEDHGTSVTDDPCTDFHQVRSVRGADPIDGFIRDRSGLKIYLRLG